MPVLDSDLQIGRDLYDVNVFGVIAVTQAFFPLLREARGMVANVGSIVGAIPLGPYQGMHYISRMISTCQGKYLPLNLGSLLRIFQGRFTLYWRIYAQ